ncbi:MAG TPA: hypothetical protein VK610_07005 [Rhodothermales bacterium]|nr:hypothetical protein [Rhodothermales bacterium]
MAGLPRLSPDFSEFVELLDAHEVRYLLVGGYAVAFHGHPRYTKDLDVWVERSPENAKRLLAALDAFGFGTIGLTEEDLTSPDAVIQLGQPPHRIDLMTKLAGVTFEACYAQRAFQDHHGLQIPFIDVESLKQNKRATGRAQDLADAERLDEG